MKSIKLTQKNMKEVASNIVDVINHGGIACFPCNGSYRLAVNYNNEDAVIALLQSKRRISRAPGLVFVKDQNEASKVGKVEAPADPLIKKYWPGALTVLVQPEILLPKKLLKQITSKKGKLGVRVPDDRLTQMVLELSGKTLLISSANRVKKHGESSPAQIQKNFAATVDLFVNLGDLPMGSKSTIVDPTGDALIVVREGALKEADIFGSRD